MRAALRLPAAAWYCLTLRESGIVGRLKAMGLVLPALALRRHARRERLGHVFVHSCAGAAHVVALCRVLGGPGYSLRLGGDIDIYGKDQRSKMKRATVVVGAAAVNREQAVEVGGVAPDRAIWSWLGVETSKYQPNGEGAEPGENGDGTLRLVTVARLNHAKGHRFAIEAVGELVRRGVRVTYTLVGDGPERAAIEGQIAALGMEGVVGLAGSLDEDAVRGALGAADVFVLPTSGRGEGSPVAVLEAMSAGLAIVATDVGGLREMVAPEQGMIVPPADAGALGEALAALAVDSEGRAAMGRSSRARAEREFDVDRVAGRLLGRFFAGEFADAREADAAVTDEQGGRGGAAPAARAGKGVRGRSPEGVREGPFVQPLEGRVAP
ncbi:MAG: glycosyltransferase [Phycisphaerales bacterium]